MLKIHIGHTRLTQSYWMNVEHVIRSVACDYDLTLEHTLNVKNAEVIQRYYDAENLALVQAL